jgi:hypothetical protein
VTDAGYSCGDEPAIRRSASNDAGIAAYLCPFCGQSSLLLSNVDLGIDTERVEVYCDNARCDAREIILLIRRGEGTHDRADVQALRAVDDGTTEEQEADGAMLRRDGDGNVESRAWTLEERGRLWSRGERDHRVLARRRRPSIVTVRPRPDDA